MLYVAMSQAHLVSMTSIQQEQEKATDEKCLCIQMSYKYIHIVASQVNTTFGKDTCIARSFLYSVGAQVMGAHSPFGLTTTTAMHREAVEGASTGQRGRLQVLSSSS